MMITQTSGSLSKLAGVLEQHYTALGLDKENNTTHWTILSTYPTTKSRRPRILVTIEFPDDPR